MNMSWVYSLNHLISPSHQLGLAQVCVQKSTSLVSMSAAVTW